MVVGGYPWDKEIYSWEYCFVLDPLYIFRIIKHKNKCIVFNEYFILLTVAFATFLSSLIIFFPSNIDMLGASNKFIYDPSHQT